MGISAFGVTGAKLAEGVAGSNAGEGPREAAIVRCAVCDDLDKCRSSSMAYPAAHANATAEQELLCRGEQSSSRGVARGRRTVRRARVCV